VLPERPRDEFLAGAGLAEDQYADGLLRHAPDLLVNRLHRPALADEGELALSSPPRPTFSRPRRPAAAAA